jgi:hypothetical protein
MQHHAGVERMGRVLEDSSITKNRVSEYLNKRGCADQVHFDRCGEYNIKGSLKVYGLSPNSILSTISSNLSAGSLQNSVMKNRQIS